MVCCVFATYLIISSRSPCVHSVGSLRTTLRAAAAITLINPHVYLDTLVLLTISAITGVNKLAFGAAARPVLCFFQHLAMAVICSQMRQPVGGYLMYNCCCSAWLSRCCELEAGIESKFKSDYAHVVNNITRLVVKSSSQIGLRGNKFLHPHYPERPRQ